MTKTARLSLFLSTLPFLLMLMASISTYAQTQDDFATPPASTPAPVTGPGASSQSAVSPTKNRAVKVEPLNVRPVPPQPVSEPDLLSPGWDSKRPKFGIGYSESFLSGAPTFILEQYLGDVSFSYYFGMKKNADSFNSDDSTTVSGIGPVSTTTTHTDTGSKNPYQLSLGFSYNNKIYQNEWIHIRWGLFAGLDYYTTASYNVGQTQRVVSSATPATADVNEIGVGTVKKTQDPTLKLGPVVDAFFSIRWFPQLSVGFQGGLLYRTDSNMTTQTNTRTRTYQTINGVDQTPTASSSVDDKAVSKAGSSLSTFAVGGTTFSLMGSFSIRYVW